MTYERRNISGPEEWFAAFEEAAHKKGQTLSEWIGNACLAALDKETRKSLPERVGRGRPRAEDTK